MVAAKASSSAWSSAPRLPGFEMVSRTMPGSTSSTSSRPVPAGLLEDNERIALGDRLTLLDEDLLDHALVLGLDRHLHLHRLENHDRVALLHRVAYFDFDLPDRSGDVGLDLGQLEEPPGAGWTARREHSGARGVFTEPASAGWEEVAPTASSLASVSRCTPAESNALYAERGSVMAVWRGLDDPV